MRQGAFQVDVDSQPPRGLDAWVACVRELRGGFFQLPAAAALTLPTGRPLFVSWYAGAEQVGAAVGVIQRCRFGRDHIRFAAPPVLRDDISQELALGQAAQELRQRGTAEVHIPSFDFAGAVPCINGAAMLPARVEYVIALRDDAEQRLARLSTTLRRRLRQGVRAGWTLRVAAPAESAELLYAAQATAADRAHARGAGYAAAYLPSTAIPWLTQPGAASGAAVFVAESSGELLTALLIGWAGCRAFYLRGGSTARGYEAHAAVWLHWMVMETLKESGITMYNLGGTPADAQHAAHAQHGLFRFKTGLGADVVPSRGIRVSLRPLHLTLHRVLAQLSRSTKRVAASSARIEP